MRLILASTDTKSIIVDISKIISGAQTGADRAALDWAISHEIPHAGWCPKGRRAEDGIIPDLYNLVETPSKAYLQRTEWNVRDSDGTVIITTSSTLAGGSKRTAEFANAHGKPWIHIYRGRYLPGQVLEDFVAKHRIKVLNIAGTRGSKDPKVYDYVLSVLDKAFDSKEEEIPGLIDGHDEG